MKNIIATIAISMILAGFLISGCDSSSKEVDAAREEVKISQEDSKTAQENARIAQENAKIAQNNLNKAIEDSTKEFLIFKSESEKRIDNYEKSISDIKDKLAAEKKYNTKLNQKNLSYLEMKREELKRTLADYKRDGTSDWGQFKYNLNNDIEALDKSITDFFAVEKK